MKSLHSDYSNNNSSSSLIIPAGVPQKRNPHSRVSHIFIFLYTHNPPTVFLQRETVEIPRENFLVGQSVGLLTVNHIMILHAYGELT